MSLSLSIVPVGFAEAEKALRGIAKGFPKAAAEAINRGLVAGRKVAVQGIRQRYKIAAGALKAKGMTVKKATWKRIEGDLAARGPMLPVSLFTPRVKVIQGSKRKVVSAEIIKGHRKVIKGAFMPKSGRVMERRQTARYPIFPVSTIGVPYMVRHQKLSEKIQETISKVTRERLHQQVNLFLSGVRK